MKEWIERHPWRVLAIVLGVLLVTFAAGHLSSASGEPVRAECVDEHTRENVRAIWLEAMDEALKDRVKQLFEIWMKDDRGQPERAANGTQRGINAYLHGRSAALKWNPPPCQR